MHPLAAIARSLPAVTEGVACAGTALESRTFQVHGRAFLFLSGKVARLKLAASATDAQRRGAEVGANGWTKLPLDALPPAAVCKRWIVESHALFAGSGAARNTGKAAPKARTARRSGHRTKA
jgi:hypothetical protein